MQTDLERLQAEISRLMAALEDVNFECQRLEIVNKNLDFQLKEANRELRQNIAVLEALESENRAARPVAGARVMEYKLNCAQLRQMAPRLHAGDRVLLTGRVYTSRDAAHKRIVAAMDAGEPLPYDLQDAVIYYAGPTPAPEGLAVGACGPTTSSRMDPYAPRLLDAGVVAMVGKGERNAAVCDAIARNKAVYLCAIGGAGALASKCITTCKVIAYEDLGCESVKELEFADFPLTVAIACDGSNLFDR